jgi:hypothetical protein
MAFVGRSLIEKLGLELKSSNPQAIADALGQVHRELTLAAYEPLIRRSQLADDIQRQVEMNLDADHQRITAEQIAQIAFASNVSLALVEALKTSGQDFATFDRLAAQSIPEWKHVVLAGESEVAAADEFGPTASDNRAKSESLAQLQDRDPSKVPSRITALEKLQKIASRFSDLGYDDAVVLAQYLVGQVDLQEWLAVERVAPSFARWPTLALAISDGLADPEIELDQALSVARFFLGNEYSLPPAGAWREELKRELFLHAARMARRTASMATADQLNDWDKLHELVVHNSAERLELLGGTAVDRAPAKLIAAAAKKLACQLQAEDRVRIERALQLMNGDETELEQVVFANQILVEVVAAQMRDRSQGTASSASPSVPLPVPAPSPASLIVFEYEQLMKEKTSLGDRLYVTEHTLLRLWTNQRQYLLSQLLQKK